MKQPFTIIDALSLKTFLSDTPIALTPDGSFVAYAVPLKSWLGRVTGDFLLTGAPSCVEGSEIWVTEIRTGKTQNLTSGWGASWAPVWSPDGSRLAFYSDKNDVAQLWIWNRQTGETSLACEEATRGFLPADTPQWTPDGKRIAFKLHPKGEPSTEQNQHEEKLPSITVWECGLEDAQKPLTGILAPVWWAEGCLADIGLVELETGQVSVLATDLRTERMAMSPDGRFLAAMLLSSDESAKAGKVHRDLCLLPIDGGEPIQLLLSLPLSHIVPFSWAPDSERIAYIIEGHIWVVSTESGTPQNLTEGCSTGSFNDEEPPLWSADGRYLFGIADNQVWAISPDNKHARSLTEGLSRNVRGAVHAVDNLQIFASAGYAVLVPDMPQKEGGPAKQLLGLVSPAIDEVIKQGIADPERLGLVGHSYGGYCVNILITQTKRFRAAMSVFGMCDLVSFYGSMNSEGDNPFVGFVESGQVNLGCSLWESPELYIENSPIFFLDKVETPLLLVSAAADEVDDQQAREMFSGLRRLSKRAVLVRYPNEAHSFNKEENAVDYWNRVLSWFDEHLKE